MKKTTYYCNNNCLFPLSKPSLFVGFMSTQYRTCILTNYKDVLLYHYTKLYRHWVVNTMVFVLSNKKTGGNILYVW